MRLEQFPSLQPVAEIVTLKRKHQLFIQLILVFIDLCNESWQLNYQKVFHSDISQFESQYTVFSLLLSIPILHPVCTPIFLPLQSLSDALISLQMVYPRRNLSADQWRNAQLLSLISAPSTMLNPAQSDTVSITENAVTWLTPVVTIKSDLTAKVLTENVGLLFVDAL